MQAAFQSGLAWASDSISNPVLRLVFELIADPKKETAATGCLVLGEVGIGLCPFHSSCSCSSFVAGDEWDKDVLQVAKRLQALAPGLWKVVLRLLNSAHYQARPHLIAAIASCSPDCMSVSGLIAMRPDSMQPYLSQVIGQPAAGPDSAPPSGMLGCCTCQDWLVRKAAADALRAIAVGAGMYQDESQIQATISAVASVKHDKMRPVRSAAGETTCVLKDLQVRCLVRGRMLSPRRQGGRASMIRSSCLLQRFTGNECQSKQWKCIADLQARRRQEAGSLGRALLHAEQICLRTGHTAIPLRILCQWQQPQAAHALGCSCAPTIQALGS